MRIAQIAPIIESVPPKKYGGTERVIAALTDELVKRGHDVTLFASGDSKTSAKLESVTNVSLRAAGVKNIYGHNMWSLMNVGHAYTKQHEFDIIHDHNSQNNPISLPLANISKTPVVMTLHGPVNGDFGFLEAGKGQDYYEMYDKPHLVTISNKQQKPAPHLNYAGTVYHGLPMVHYPFSKTHDNYLLFVGRIHLYNGVEEKGLHHAIDIAKALDMPLKIAAKIDEASQEDLMYFKQVIEPQLNDKIQFLGEVDEGTRNQLMSKAKVLLHTINFEEPFGLTLIESMACGLPIVAFGKGSIPELVKHGVVGYVVNNTAEAIEAVKKIDRIDRAKTRSYALSNFSPEVMAKGYEKIYRQILTKNHPADGVPTQQVPAQPHTSSISLYHRQLRGLYPTHYSGSSHK